MMSKKCPSLSLLTDFSLKSILLDSRIATPTCFLGPFDWKTFFQPFTQVMSVFEIKVYFLYNQKAGSCFHIHSLSLCLFIGKLSPLIVRDINDQWLIPAIFW